MNRVSLLSLASIACLVSPAVLAAPPEPPAPTVEPAEDFRRPVDHELMEDEGKKQRHVDRGEILTLAEVLDSVNEHDPRLAAANQQVEVAKGQVLSARGGFDTSVNLLQIYEPLYRGSTTRIHVEQAIPVYGLTAWAGWQIGFSGTPGQTPVLDPGSAGRLLQAKGGEVFGGVTLPLVRDGWTDRRRTDIKQTKLERERMDYVRDATQLQLELEAATAYWNWVAAGMQVEIERQLLGLAVTRHDKLQRQIELGAVDRLAGIDNARVILDREGRVVMAERTFQGTALALSLYLRDGSGDPSVAGAERLPNSMPNLPAPPSPDIDAEIAAALDKRPDRRAQIRSREQSDVELRWARNQRTPRVDLSAWASHEIGANPFTDAGETDPERTELFTSLNVEIPIPMRGARGQVQSAEASLDVVASELRLLDDQIGVQVADAHAAVAAAHQRALLASEQVALTQELAQAELRRFELGDGDLLLVNLRELAIADAGSTEVTAIADYFIAKANLEVAKGVGVQPVDP